MPRKSLKREDICLNQFLMQTKVPYSGGKKSQRVFISEEWEWESEFKSGTDRLTLLFCANVFRFITYKTTNPQDLKGNVNCSCKPSGCTARRTRQVPFSFLHWFHGCFGAKVGSTVKVCLNFFFFFKLDSVPGLPELHELNTRSVYLHP